MLNWIMPSINQFNVSLWGDEGFSAILSMKPIPEIIKTIASDTAPPLYNITEHLAFKFFGTSEVVVRGLSFFYYLIAVLFIYLIGSYLFNKKTAIIGAVLTFLNPFFFIYAFEGRMYSILAATVTASMYFFIRKKWLPYVIATLAALYSHHFAIFALFVQGLWFIHEFIFGDRHQATSMFKSFVLIIVGYLPWVAPLYKQTQMVGSGFWLGRPTFKDLTNLLSDYLAQGQHHLLARPALIITLTILVLRNWSEKVKSSLFLLTWFLIPIVATWVVSQYFTPVFYNRYLIYSIPPAMMLLASNSRRFSQNLIYIVVAFFAIISWFYFTHPTKDPFNELAAYVQQTRRGDDFVINGNPGKHKLWESKFYGIDSPIYVPSGEELPFFVGTALMEEKDIISELPKPKRNNPFRIGIINNKEDSDPAIEGYLLEDTQEFGNLRFNWYSIR